MNSKYAQIVFLVLIVGAAFVMSRLGKHATPTTLPDISPSTRAVVPPAPSAPIPVPDAPSRELPVTPAAVARPGVAFRTRAQLLEHFDKHGREFGAKSVDDYLRLAQSLRDAPKGGSILETTRATDGVVTRFDRKTGAFLACNPDGTIRTFFHPDDGESYFRRQIDRPEDRP